MFGTGKAKAALSSVCRRANLWKGAFRDFDLDPTSLSTKGDVLGLGPGPVRLEPYIVQILKFASLDEELR